MSIANSKAPHRKPRRAPASGPEPLHLTISFRQGEDKDTLFDDAITEEQLYRVARFLDRFDSIPRRRAASGRKPRTARGSTAIQPGQ